MVLNKLTAPHPSLFSLAARGKLLILAVIMLLLWHLGSLSSMTADEQLLWEKVRSAQQHLYQWKPRFGDEADKRADPWKCGLIGVEWSGITTTLGDLRAKRTACNPAWAVQFKRWFEQQGLKAGDRIAIYSSSSFPGLLLSAIAASEAMQLDPLLVVSLGASTWGANQPDYPWPVLASELRRSGFIKTRADFYTLGGGAEMSHDLAAEGVTLLRNSALQAGVELLTADQLAGMVELKYRLLKNHRAKLLLSIGGSHANLGDDYDVLNLPTGPVPAKDVAFSGNGVIGFAMRDNIPVIHMLNIKRLAEVHGIAYDSPPIKTAPGRSNAWLPGAGLLLFLIVLFRHQRWKLEPPESNL